MTGWNSNAAGIGGDKGLGLAGPKGSHTTRDGGQWT